MEIIQHVLFNLDLLTDVTLGRSSHKISRDARLALCIGDNMKLYVTGVRRAGGDFNISRRIYHIGS
jgi:hypothetical protein